MIMPPIEINGKSSSVASGCSPAATEATSVTTMKTTSSISASLSNRAQLRCYLCEIPKQEYSLIRSFSEAVCRGCLNYEGPDRIEMLISEARCFKSCLASSSAAQPEAPTVGRQWVRRISDAFAPSRQSQQQQNDTQAAWPHQAASSRQQHATSLESQQNERVPVQPEASSRRLTDDGAESCPVGCRTSSHCGGQQDAAAAGDRTLQRQHTIATNVHYNGAKTAANSPAREQPEQLGSRSSPAQTNAGGAKSGCSSSLPTSQPQFPGAHHLAYPHMYPLGALPVMMRGLGPQTASLADTFSLREQSAIELLNARFNHHHRSLVAAEAAAAVAAAAATTASTATATTNTMAPMSVHNLNQHNQLAPDTTNSASRPSSATLLSQSAEQHFRLGGQQRQARQAQQQPPPPPQLYQSSSPYSSLMASYPYGLHHPLPPHLQQQYCLNSATYNHQITNQSQQQKHHQPAPAPLASLLTDPRLKGIDMTPTNPCEHFQGDHNLRRLLQNEADIQHHARQHSAPSSRLGVQDFSCDAGGDQAQQEKQQQQIRISPLSPILTSSGEKDDSPTLLLVQSSRSTHQADAGANERSKNKEAPNESMPQVRAKRSYRLSELSSPQKRHAKELLAAASLEQPAFGSDQRNQKQLGSSPPSAGSVENSMSKQVANESNVAPSGQSLRSHSHHHHSQQQKQLRSKSPVGATAAPVDRDRDRDRADQQQLSSSNKRASPSSRRADQQSAAALAAYGQLKCMLCNERLEDRHFVQCPSVLVHKFCFACSKMSIQQQQSEAKAAKSDETKIFCPSGKKCLLANDRSAWSFMTNEIETIFRESAKSSNVSMLASGRSSTPPLSCAGSGKELSNHERSTGNKTPDVSKLVASPIDR